VTADLLAETYGIDAEILTAADGAPVAVPILR